MERKIRAITQVTQAIRIGIITFGGYVVQLNFWLGTSIVFLGGLLDVLLVEPKEVNLRTGYKGGILRALMLSFFIFAGGFLNNSNQKLGLILFVPIMFMGLVLDTKFIKYKWED